MTELDDNLLLRYARHIMLPEVDIAGQQRICAAHALIIGLGGLGSPVAMYLAAAGVGTLTLVDYDTVELSNLQRQIVHTTASLKQRKVDSARAQLLALNPHVEIITHACALEAGPLADAVRAADVVLDCTDNFASRFAINAACVAARKPLVSGAAIRFEGQVGVFNAGADAPCYRCLYPEAGGVDESCAQNGVFAPLLGVIGSMQALEALKLLAGVYDDIRGAERGGLDGRLLLFDGIRSEWNSVTLPRDPACPVCATR